jgi:hypothetical protein
VITLYNVSLVNLAPGARSAGESLPRIDRPAINGEEMRALLRTFAEIDPVENAVAEPEIRVKVRHESYLIRTGQKKLMLYDVARRDQPALILSLDEVMAELDGSAAEARATEAALHQQAAQERPVTLPLPDYAAPKASKPRLIVLGSLVVLFASALAWLQPGWGQGTSPAGFRALARTEATTRLTALTGVYLTGHQPGDHGIVIARPDEVKLFELQALNAPRLVYASAELGIVGSQLVLVTDQPGGAITVKDQDTLVYCGETYRRIP